MACRHAWVSMPYWAASSLPAPGSFGLDEFRQGEVHVVAAEQQMVADGLADEAEFALLLDSLDEAEVARAAADIDDETARTRLELVGFRRGMSDQPAIERGLRFLEQRRILQSRPCLPLPPSDCGPHRQTTPARSGRLAVSPGDRRDRSSAMTIIPALDEMVQIACGGFDRRDAGDVRRCGPGKQAGGAIDAGVTEP